MRIGERNTWFIAYAPAEARDLRFAMVIENGESGGGTTAPKVCAILKGVFGRWRLHMISKLLSLTGYVPRDACPDRDRHGVHMVGRERGGRPGGRTGLPRHVESKQPCSAAFGLVLYFLFAFHRLIASRSGFSPFRRMSALSSSRRRAVFGSTVYGGRRWLWFFQPSEISKAVRDRPYRIAFRKRQFARVEAQLFFLGVCPRGAIIGVPSL